MKKLLMIILISTFVIFGCGKDEENPKTEKETNINEISESKEDIDGFVYPDYEKYNSYASENGLDGDLIYVEGKVIGQTILGEDGDKELFINIEQEDKNRWCISVPTKNTIDEIENETIRVFGTYLGFSDVANLPGLSPVVTSEEKMQLGRIELLKDGEYSEVWGFEDLYNDNIMVSDLYNKELLHTETFGDVSCEIPKVFLENVRENNEWKYYYYEDLMFSVNIVEFSEGTNNDFVNYRDGYISGIKGNLDNPETLSEDIVSINSRDAIFLKFEQNYNSEPYISNSVAFIYDGNYYNFAFVWQKYSGVDYSLDFQEFIDTIHFENEKESETIIKETEEIVEPKEPILLTSGKYIVGEDIPEGKYDVIGVERGNIYVSSNGGKTANELIATIEVGENIYKNLRLRNGYEVEIVLGGSVELQPK